MGLSIEFNPVGKRQTRASRQATGVASRATLGQPEGATGPESPFAIPQAILDEDRYARSVNLGGHDTDMDADDRKMPARPSIGNKRALDGDGTDSEADHGIDQVNDNASDLSSEDASAGSVATVPDRGPNNPNHNPDDRNITAFREYCYKASAWGAMTQDHARGIKLLDILRRKKAPLDSYDDLQRWHLEEIGALYPDEGLGQCPDYLSRKVLLPFLMKRYNMSDKMPFEKEVVLPHSNARIKVICFDARNCVEQLLTDPRLGDDDFSFYDNNPLAAPPQSRSTIGGLTTGDAYRNAYASYVNGDNQVGIGIQWYIDGAVTGQFQNLSITALKMSLSCFTLDYRKKDRAWAILGFVVNYSEGRSRGKRMFADSQHDQAVEELYGAFVSNEGQAATGKVDKAQDFHKQLDTILTTYVSLEASGMLWDLCYRDKVYRNVILVFWTVMVRADTDEAELLCGKYRSRSKHVKMLCRYCTCPTSKGDSPHANYEAKTVSMIKDLMEIKDVKGLKDISQQYIDNAFYKLRFDPTYNTGIHGACPSEMLHAVLLGIFLYVRECFFAQIGPTSQLAKDIDGLAQEYGALYAHNSDRNLPNCKFTHGIKAKKKLMAMEYRGVLLLIATVLRSSKGRELLSKNPHFENPDHVKDWLMLVESLLEWEAFLCEPKMRVSDVKRLDKKNRFIMYLFRKVARRSTGMGLKIMKFHAITHMASDILLYGVPKEHDTGTNESGHKVTKVAAKLTQKNMKTFEIQTARRLMEFLLVEWGMAELHGNKRRWKYYRNDTPYPIWPPTDTDEDATASQLVPPTHQSATGGTNTNGDDEEEEYDPPVTTGTRLEVYWDSEDDPYMGIKPKGNQRQRSAAELDRTAVYNSDNLVHFLLALQDKMAEVTDDQAYDLPIYTEHKRNGEIFRGHPNYRQDGYWRDWARIDWGEDEENELPAQIWCFVTLDGIPLDHVEEYGGVPLENTTYAVVESGQWEADENQVTMSDIFVPIIKEVEKFDKTTGAIKERRFYLADVEAITSPICVIPDIGAKPCHRYLAVKPRDEWVEMFLLWLRDDHNLDVMSVSDSDSESDSDD